MAATTVANWVTNLAAVSVTGVSRSIAYPPHSIQSADLPYQYVRNVEVASSNDGSVSQYETLGAQGYAFSGDIVIAVQAANLEQASQNYTDLQTYMDRLLTALDSASLTWAPAEYRIVMQDQEPIEVAGAVYWGIVATVTGDG